MKPLVYVSTQVTDNLRTNISVNIGRYAAGDFNNMITPEWALPSSLEVDVSALQNLNADGESASEVQNSITVWNALPKMSPAVATERRIWTRLAHVEALEFSRQRWLTDASGKLLAGADIEKAVAAHFFGEFLTRYRDDHSIGRYWWNAMYAARIADENLTMHDVLALLLKRADLRSNLLERSETSAQRALARAIFGRLKADSSLASDEERFRAFMRNLNVRGGGVLCAAVPSAHLDTLVAGCVPP